MNCCVVQVRVETCEELRVAGVGGTAGAALAMPQGQYGFTDKVYICHYYQVYHQQWYCKYL